MRPIFKMVIDKMKLTNLNYVFEQITQTEVRNPITSGARGNNTVPKMFTDYQLTLAGVYHSYISIYNLLFDIERSIDEHGLSLNINSNILPSDHEEVSIFQHGFALALF